MRLRTLVLTLLALGCLAGAFAATQPIKIGGLFDLTGKASNVGTTTRDVALMVVAQINEKGGVKGRKIELVVADTESEPSKAVVALHRLIEKDKVTAIIGPTTTGAAMACIPVIEEAKIPMVACVGGDAPVDPVHKWVFKTPQRTTTAVDKIYEYLRDNQMNEVALLCASDKFGQEGEALLKKQASEYRIKILAQESFNPTDADMTAQLMKVAAVKPKTIIIWTIGPAGAIIAKNAQRAKLSKGIRLMQCHGQPDHNYIKLAGLAANHTMMPATKLMVATDLSRADPQRQGLLTFTELFHKKGLGMIGTHSGYAWDAIQIVTRAMEKAGTEPEALRAAIENTKDYVGVSGIYSMSPTDHCGLKSDSLVMIMVEKDKWKLLTK